MNKKFMSSKQATIILYEVTNAMVEKGIRGYIEALDPVLRRSKRSSKTFPRDQALKPDV